MYADTAMTHLLSAQNTNFLLENVSMLSVFVKKTDSSPHVQSQYQREFSCKTWTKAIQKFEDGDKYLQMDPLDFRQWLLEALLKEFKATLKVKQRKRKRTIETLI